MEHQRRERFMPNRLLQDCLVILNDKPKGLAIQVYMIARKIGAFAGMMRQMVPVSCNKNFPGAPGSAFFREKTLIQCA